MATYYLDYENGSDANTGSAWGAANAWKTITSGATAARIAPGDIIRIAKSPDPTSLGITATWTDLSKTVTLASALNATVDLCETAWTASANVTATTSTTRKQGSYSESLAIAAGFTTGKVAYKALGASTDFSAYQQLSFWIRNNATIAAGNVIRICLCSDTVGDVIVDSFYVPAIPSVNRFIAFTVDKAAALGATIQSVAVYADSDPGTITLLIDDIIVCKASSSADSLSLTSLISKNSLASGGDEGWFAIQSIVGTAILLDRDVEAQPVGGSNDFRGYSGTTETVTTYKRETIKTAIMTSSSTFVQEVQDSGTDGNLIYFEGGFNTGTSTQDGETFFDGQNGWGRGIVLSAKNYISLNRLSVVKYDYGIFVSNANMGIISCQQTSHCAIGTYIYNGSANFDITIKNINANYYLGLALQICSQIRINVVNANSNSTYYRGIDCSTSIDCVITASNAKNNPDYGVKLSGSSGIIIKNLTTSNNSNGGVNFDHASKNYLQNCILNESTEVSTDTFSNNRLISKNHDNVAGVHKIFTDYGVIDSEATIRHTASGVSWRLSPTSTNRTVNYPLDLAVARKAVTANNLVTVKAWMRRSNTGLTMSLVCRGGQIAGVVNNVSASMTAAADTWEELTITFTPTEAGVIEIEAWAYGGTAYLGYVDDITFTQA